jgi:hypothetical protein
VLVIPDPLRLSIDHHPINLPIERHDFSEQIPVFAARNGYKIGSKSGPNPAERVLLT